MLEKDANRLIFIIAHKYIRGYPTYTQYYVDTIQRLYVNPLIIIVDNNSLARDDIFNNLKDYKDVILLDNNISCKFEIGAYQVGMKYLIDHNIISNYSYCVCAQDNFILKNYFDFNQLRINNITACPINSFYPDGECPDIVKDVLTRLNLYNNLDKMNFCWCSKFCNSNRSYFSNI